MRDVFFSSRSNKLCPAGLEESQLIPSQTVEKEKVPRAQSRQVAALRSSKRRINQQATEGGWGVRKIGRNQYLLSEDEERTSVFRSDIKISDQQRLDYENEIRDRLDQIHDPSERIQLICILTEMELDRLRPKEKWPELDNDDGDLNNEEIDWLLSNCY